MNFLIIGGSSSIGRAIGDKLKSSGTVKYAGRKQADLFFDLSDWEAKPHVIENFDVIVHVAADFGGATTDDYIRSEMVNAVGTLSVCRLAEACQAKHLVVLSSLSAAYQLGDPYYSIYALSKKHAEETARFFCSERELALTILRPSQVYDAEGKCRKHQPLLYSMADSAQAGHDINIYGNRDPLRNYLYLDDLSTICSLVINTRTTGTFDCAHPKSLRLSEVAQAAFSAFNNGGSVQFDHEKSNLFDLPSLPTHFLYRELGFYPLVDMKQGFERIRTFRAST